MISADHSVDVQILLYTVKSIISLPVSLDELQISFLGDFMEFTPPQTLIETLETFLNYATDLGKLEKDFKLYGERQVQRNTTSPGDKLYEILQQPPFDTHFDFNITELAPVACNINWS